MKRANIRKQVSKTTLILLIFMALTLVFTLTQASLREVEAPLPMLEQTDDITALAAGGNQGSVKAAGITVNGSSSYHVSTATSTSQIESRYSTSTNHPAYSATYNDNYWKYGDTGAWHTGGDTALAILHIDLGDRIKLLIDKGLVSTTFSGYIDKSGAKEWCFSISSSATSRHGNYYGNSSAYDQIGKYGTDTVHYNNWSESAGSSSGAYSATNSKLGGKYLMVALGMYDSTGNFGSVTMNMSTFNINVSDTVKPTVTANSTSYSNDSTIYITSNTVSLVDSGGSGLYSASCTSMTLPGGGSGSTSSFTASCSNQPNSTTATFDQQGTYAISVEDTAGNKSTFTVVYFNPTAKITPNDGNMGTTGINGSLSMPNLSTSQQTLNGKTCSQSYYVFAQAKQGYYFKNFSRQIGSTTTTQNGAWFSTTDNTHTWYQTHTIASTPDATEYVWKGMFGEIYPLISYNGTALTTNKTTLDFDYTGNTILLKESSAASGYTFSYKVNGTDLAGNTYTNETTLPIYAGTYTIGLTVNKGSSPVGYQLLTVTIKPLTLNLMPMMADNVNNMGAGKNNKVYDGTTTAYQSSANGWDYNLADSVNSASLKSLVLADSLAYTTASGVLFNYKSKDVGTHEITVTGTTPALTITSNKANAEADVKNAIAASYTPTVYTTGLQGEIKPALLTIACAGYGQIVDGTIYNWYSKDSSAWSTNSISGKIYDGTKDGSFYGITIYGNVSGDTIGLTKTAGSTALASTTTVGTRANPSPINYNITATFTSYNAGTYGSGQITSEAIYLTGASNYSITGANVGGGYASGSAYSNQPITLTLASSQTATIQPKTVYIEFINTTSDAVDPSKEYNGLAETNCAYQIKDGCLVTVQGVGLDPIYPDSSNVTCIFNTNDVTATYVTASGLKLKVGPTITDPDQAATILANYTLASDVAYVPGTNLAETKLTTVNGKQVAISPRSITPTLAVNSKVYDSSDCVYNPVFGFVKYNTDKTEAVAIIEGDNITVADSVSVKFTSSAVTQTGQAIVNATGITLTSTNDKAKNYTLPTTSSLQVTGLTISARNISTYFNNADDLGNLVTVDAIPDHVYDGTRYTPTPNVYDTIKTSMVDETLNLKELGYLSYTPDNSNNLNATTGEGFSITITASGNYTGSITVYAKIQKADVIFLPITQLDEDGEKMYDGDVEITKSFPDIIVTFGATVTAGSIDANGLIIGSIKANPVNNEDNSMRVAGTFTFENGAISNNGVALVNDSGVKKVTFTPTDLTNFNIPATQTVTLTVNKRAVTVYAKAQTQVYGANADKLDEGRIAEWFSSTKDTGYTVSSRVDEKGNHSGYVDGDLGVLQCVLTSMTYGLDKNVNVMVGEYPITYAPSNYANENYVVTYEGANYTITQRKITVTADRKEKVYGENDPALTYSYTNPFPTGTLPIEGTLVRTEGENVGTGYVITGGTLLTSEFNKQNYENFENSFTGQGFSITARKVIITPNSIENYFGEDIIIDKFNVTVTGVEGNATSGIAPRDLTTPISELFSGLNIVRTYPMSNSGDDVSIEVGTYDLYINVTDKTPNPNYELVNRQSTRGTYVIKARPVVVTPNALTKQYTEVDPKLTFTVTPHPDYLDVLSKTNDKGAIVGEAGNKAIAGSLTRTIGNALYPSGQFDDVGIYDVQQGTVQNGTANKNYDITFVIGVKFTITALEVTVTASQKEDSEGNLQPLIQINVGDTLPDDSTIAKMFTVSPAIPIEGVANTSATLVGADPLKGGLRIPQSVRDNPIIGDNDGYYNLEGDDTLTSSIQNPNYIVKIVAPRTIHISKRTAVVTPTLSQGSIYGSQILLGNGANQIALTYVMRDKISNEFYDDSVIAANFSGALTIDDYQVETEGENQGKLYYYTKNGDSSNFEYKTLEKMGENGANGVEGSEIGQFTKHYRLYLNAGKYKITLGTMKGSDDYDVTLSNEAVYFTVHTRNVKVLVDESASNLSRAFGTQNYNIDSSTLAPGAFHTENAIAYTLDFEDDEPNAVFLDFNLDVTLEPLRRESGNNVGSYKINLGNLQAKNSNYSFSIQGEPTYTITPRSIVVRPVAYTSSVYGNSIEYIAYTTYLSDDNTVDGLLTYDVQTGEIFNLYGMSQAEIEELKSNNTNVQTDTLDGALDRVYKENWINTHASTYDINIGTLNSTTLPTYNGNYALTLDASGCVYEITRRDVTITPKNNNGHIFGNLISEDSVIGYDASGLYSTETLNGVLIREGMLGEQATDLDVPGAYNILQGTIQNENNPNYNITLVSGVKYTIKQRPVTLTISSGQSKTYGSENPEFLFTYAPNTSEGATGTNAYVSGYEPTLRLTVVDSLGNEIDENTVANTQPGYSYRFVYDDNNAFNAYYVFNESNIRTERFLVQRGVAQIAFNDATVFNESTNRYELTLTYTGEPQTVDAFIKRGDSTSTLTFNTNNQRNKRYFTLVGEYTMTISASGGALYNGSQVEVRIKVLPYDLGNVDFVEEGYITAEQLTKVYGSSDEGKYTFNLNGTLANDLVTATIDRETGENVGTYNLNSISLAITNSMTETDETILKSIVAPDPSSVAPCYVIAFAENSGVDRYSITPKPLTLNPQVFVKTYGEADPSLTEIISDVDDVTVTYTRTLGEDATREGVAYNLDSFSIDNENYVASWENENANLNKFIILKRDVTVTADALQKTFDGNPIDLSGLTYTFSGFVALEAPTGSLTIEGETVNAGEYDIVAVGFDTASNPNYNVTFIGAKFTVNRYNITLTPNGVTYEYGDKIAPFTYSVTDGTVFEGFPLVGELGTLEVASKGEHIIPQGTLTNENNPNYNIIFANAGIYCTITPRYLTITAKSATQVYGDPLTEIEYEISGNLLDGDVLEGRLMPSADAKNVGKYEVEIGSLQDENINYEITFIANDSVYEITPRPLTITADEKVIIYGNEHLPLTYQTDNLVEGDIISGSLACAYTDNVGSYTILRGTLNNTNYAITYVSATYAINQRPLEITIRNAASDFGAEDAALGYDITEGTVVYGDDLQIELSRESGTEMGFYAITGVCLNENYIVTFVNGTYTIKKYNSHITVETAYISFVEDGKGRKIVASCDSGAEIIYSIGKDEVNNLFREAGKYVVTLTAPETDSYYAPEPVNVYITINRPSLSTEESGIDITLESSNGFDPTLTVEMTKLPSDYMDILAELTNKQKIVRAFTLTTQDDSSIYEKVDGKTTVTIKVPTALKQEPFVQVMVRENGVYNLEEIEVIDGYVTFEVDDLSSFAFITEEDNNYLFLILIGVAALIMVGSMMVFLLRKRP